jgi:hypothetical protein
VGMDMEALFAGTKGSANQSRVEVPGTVRAIKTNAGRNGQQPGSQENGGTVIIHNKTDQCW